MPLFFTISGIFAARAVACHWRVLAKTRIAKLLYLYALWLLIHTLILTFTPGFPTDRARTFGQLLEQLTITRRSSRSPAPLRLRSCWSPGWRRGRGGCSPAVPPGDQTGP
jgi:hypothetical protein